MKRSFSFIPWTLCILCLAVPVLSQSSSTQPTGANVVERRLRVSGQNSSAVDQVLELFERDSLAVGENHQATNILITSRLQEMGLTPEDLRISVNFAVKEVDLTITAKPGHVDVQQAADQVASYFVNAYSKPSGVQADQDRQKLSDMQNRIDELQARHEAYEAQTRKQTGAVDVSPASVQERMASLQMQKESATIELAAKQARSDALAEQISKFSSQIQDKIKADPIADELSKVVDARQKEFDHVLSISKAGAASSTDVDQVMASLAEAKVKLLERQEAAANAAGGDIIAGWNRELMTLSVDLAELRARSKALDDRLAAYANADDYLNNADQWLTEINDLQKQESALQGKMSDEDIEYNNNHVSIEVLKPPFGATTQPAK